MPDRTEVLELGRKALAEWLETKGRQPVGIYSNYCMVEYIHEQKRHVEQTGECKPGCDNCELADHPHIPLQVCPHTIDLCKQKKLKPLIDLYGDIN